LYDLFYFVFIYKILTLNVVCDMFNQYICKPHIKMTTKQEINNLIQLANGTTVVDVLAPFKQAYTAIVDLYQ